MYPYRSIVVVGGGTAGWLAATYLQRTLGANPEFPLAITLVESAEIGVIGVGEATVPTLRHTMKLLNIPESALFKHADATLKNGIRFVGWRTGGDAGTDAFDHPFDAPVGLDGYPTMTHWLNLKQRGVEVPDYAACGVVQTALYDKALSPKTMSSPNYEAPVPYGYHLDAVKLGALLKDVAISRGVQHVVGEVVSVRRTEAGIESVRLADGRVLAGDLFVDCSGFSGLLIGKALEVPWVSYADTLLCDRAVACPVPHARADGPLLSYTTATAQPAGWTWDIDLQSRRGTGYVYASAFATEAEAEATLRRHNGAGGDVEARHLKMRVGRRARSWEQNCLSLGLASGFIEPLESTGIYLVEHAIQMFIDYLPTSDRSEQPRKKYNSLMADLYDEIRDFVVMHYVLTQRTDTPFWRACVNEVKIPDTLADNLALWREKVPSNTDINRRLSLFSSANWFFILAGMHRLPREGIGQSSYIAPKTSLDALAHIERIRQAAVQQSPTMRDYVQKVCGAVAGAPFAASAAR
jgi:flavin-dependent dehydrogenase